MLKADVDQLDRLATALDEAAKNIDAVDIRKNQDAIARALPGCDIPVACAQAGEFIEGAYLRIAQRLQQVAELTRKNAADYHATDEDFGKALRQLDFHSGKGH